MREMSGNFAKSQGKYQFLSKSGNFAFTLPRGFVKIIIPTRSNAFKCWVFGQWFSLATPSTRGREMGRSLGTNVAFGPVLKCFEDLAQGMDSKFIVNIFPDLVA